jgi:iron complex transport system ATP-binding protein
MSHLFSLNDVHYQKEGIHLLKNINVNFAEGEIVCLLGNNGSGKSTFLKLCAGLLNLNNGSVAYNNININTLSLEDRAKFIGWLPQVMMRPFNFSLSHFLRLSQNTPFEEHKDIFEVKHLKNKNINRLSGGEWKRGQLERLWHSYPKIMLLDEPDSDLDLRYKNKLIELCKDYAFKNKAIILVATHDIVFARELATRVCALSKGYLVWNSPQADFWHTQVIQKIFSAKVRA